MRVPRGVGLAVTVAAAWLAAVAPAAAQSRSGSPPKAGTPSALPGWIGFYAGTAEQGSPGAPPSIVVLAVADGSPAARAGLDEGDTLLAVDGVPLTPAGLKALSAGLRAGDLVELTLRSGGQRRTLAVRAERRPTVPTTVPDPVKIRVGATRKLLGADPDEVAAPPAPRQPSVRVRAPVAAPTLPEPDQGTPFTVHVFRDARTDSLADALKQVERRLVAARSAEAARLRELAARVRAGGRVDTNDEALRQLRSRRQALAKDEALLRGTLEQIVAELAGAAFTTVETPAEWTMTMSMAPGAEPSEPPAGADAAPPATVVRPMTPYIAGRDRIAGARLTPLNPGLAEYFGTARGVLVVEVAEGTPADAAGLRPGDVVLEVGGVDVVGLEPMRRAIAAPRATQLPLTVLRKGTRLQLTLTK